MNETTAQNACLNSNLIRGNMMSSTAEAVNIIKQHEQVFHDIADLFLHANISAKDGEEILAVMLGISMGQRQVSLTDEQNKVLDRIAAGWVIAASEE